MSAGWSAASLAPHRVLRAFRGDPFRILPRAFFFRIPGQRRMAVTTPAKCDDAFSMPDLS